MKPVNRSALLCGIGAFAITSALILIAEARACPPSEEVTVDGRNYAVCFEEDCSDQPGQIGVWRDPDTGTAYLSLGEYSVPVQP